MKPIISICIFLLLSMNLLSQSYQISGYIKDSDTGEKLIGANVYLEQSKNGTFTNEYGYFIIQSKGKNQIIISYIGYESRSIFIETNRDTLLNISLLPNTNLESIVVQAKRQLEKSNKISIPVLKLEAIPSIAGESDLMKSLTFLPGISNGKEGSSNLYIRGGTPDQNLILLDGIPVYNASHLGGYLSVFNTKSIKKIDIYKGNFPARFGDRLSSVIDIHMKDGNNKETKTEAGIGVLTSNFSIEGPIKKNKSSYMLTARYSYFGLVNLFKEKEETDYFNYWLYDINGKINIPLKKGTLYLSSYFGNDDGTIEGKYTNSFGSSGNTENGYETVINKNKLNWGNRTFALRYSVPIQSNMFLNFVLGYSKYIYKNNTTEDKTTVSVLDTTFLHTVAKEYSGFDDFLFKTRLNYTPNKTHTFLMGLGVSRKTNIVGFLNEKSNGVIDYQTVDGHFFIEDKIQITEDLTSTIGIRNVGYFLKHKSNFSFEPRLSLDFTPTEKLSFNTSFGTVKQNLHLLSRYGFGIPNDIWVPSTDSIPLQTSWQISLESKYQISPTANISVATYYKSTKKLIDYKAFNPDEEFILINWEKDIVKNGIGNAYGLEFLFTLTKERLYGLFSYTLAFSNRKFTDLNQGNWFRSNFDRRHDISGTIQYKINKKWNFSSSFIFQSGRPITLPVSRIPLPNDEFSTFSYKMKNNATLPNYHRLDVSFEKKRVSKKGNEFTTKFFVYNLYNRKNPNYIYFLNRTIFIDGQYQSDQPEIKLVSFFSFIPGIHFNYKF